MSHATALPTLEQLWHGFEVECSRSSDPDLAGLTATRVRLQLVEDLSDSNGHARLCLPPVWQYMDRDLHSCRHDKKLRVPAAPDDPPPKFDIEVLAKPPGCEHWVRCGSWASAIGTRWRSLDAPLIIALLARVIAELDLEAQMACVS